MSGMDLDLVEAGLLGPRNAACVKAETIREVLLVHGPASSLAFRPNGAWANGLQTGKRESKTGHHGRSHRDSPPAVDRLNRRPKPGHETVV